VIDPDNVVAEFSIIVRSDLKRRGLGTLLMRKMIAFLSGRGTLRLVGYVLRDNENMREMALAQGFKVDTSTPYPEALNIALTLPDLRNS
jgi:acetyltransferase